jgi:hypothetical protein
MNSLVRLFSVQELFLSSHVLIFFLVFYENSDNDGQSSVPAQALSSSPPFDIPRFVVLTEDAQHQKRAEHVSKSNSILRTSHYFLFSSVAKLSMIIGGCQ